MGLYIGSNQHIPEFTRMATVVILQPMDFDSSGVYSLSLSLFFKDVLIYLRWGGT